MLKVKRGCLIQKVNPDKFVVFDYKKSVIHTLNQTAYYIFSKIKAGWDREKTVQFLMKRYDVLEKRARADYDALVKELVKKGLLE